MDNERVILYIDNATLIRLGCCRVFMPVVIVVVIISLIIINTGIIISYNYNSQSIAKNHSYIYIYICIYIYNCTMCIHDVQSFYEHHAQLTSKAIPYYTTPYQSICIVSQVVKTTSYKDKAMAKI